MGKPKLSRPSISPSPYAPQPYAPQPYAPTTPASPDPLAPMPSNARPVPGRGTWTNDYLTGYGLDSNGDPLPGHEDIVADMRRWYGPQVQPGRMAGATAIRTMEFDPAKGDRPGVFHTMEFDPAKGDRPGEIQLYGSEPPAAPSVATPPPPPGTDDDWPPRIVAVIPHKNEREIADEIVAKWEREEAERAAQGNPQAGIPDSNDPVAAQDGRPYDIAQSGEQGGGLPSRIGPRISPPTSPVGRKGSEIKIQPGTNAPGEIATDKGSRRYSGHSFDTMQGRGLTPSIVENAIKPENLVRRFPGADVYYDPINKVQVVVSPQSGGVITAYPRSKPPKP